MADIPYSVFPEDARDLLLSMLKLDPIDRPTIDQVLQHPFFTVTSATTTDDITL